MEELKPCPFCGSVEDVEITKEDNYGNEGDYYMVQCSGCGLLFGFYSEFETKQEAIEAWNRRTPEWS